VRNAAVRLLARESVAAIASVVFQSIVRVVFLFTQLDVGGISPSKLVFTLHADRPRS
jgi:hypothetical protein